MTNSLPPGFALPAGHQPAPAPAAQPVAAPAPAPQPAPVQAAPQPAPAPGMAPPPAAPSADAFIGSWNPDSIGHSGKFCDAGRYLLRIYKVETGSKQSGENFVMAHAVVVAVLESEIPEHTRNEVGRKDYRPHHVGEEVKFMFTAGKTFTANMAKFLSPIFRVPPKQVDPQQHVAPVLRDRVLEQPEVVAAGYTGPVGVYVSVSVSHYWKKDVQQWSPGAWPEWERAYLPSEVRQLIGDEAANAQQVSSDDRTDPIVRAQIVKPLVPAS